MRTIRKGVFETNSSSTHSLIICTKEEYEKWENGDIYFDRWKQEFKTLQQKIEELKEEDWYDYETKEEWEEAAYEDLVTVDQYFYDDFLETFERSFTTPNGDEMIAFGKYGRDG